MKLRDREKRVLPNIKQEDCKQTLPNASSSTVVNMSTTTVDLTIKQEDSKDHKVSLKQDDEFGSKGYYYRCDICKQRLPNLKSVLEHRKSNHVDRRCSQTMIKNLDEEPDIHDPNFYCKSCEKGYNNTHSYRHHLRQVHYMILKPIPKWKPSKDGLDPDPNDPSFYCRACDSTYKHKEAYKQHCRYAHGLKLANSNRKAISKSLLNTYCQACDKRLSSIDSYRRHLFLIHKSDSRPATQQKRNDIMPNVNDPNFYCHSCEKKSASKNSFRRHLMAVHSIFKSAPKESILTMIPTITAVRVKTLTTPKADIGTIFV